MTLAPVPATLVPRIVGSVVDGIVFAAGADVTLKKFIGGIGGIWACDSNECRLLKTATAKIQFRANREVNRRVLELDGVFMCVFLDEKNWGLVSSLTAQIC
jgi:hypothetical protein